MPFPPKKSKFCQFVGIEKRIPSSWKNLSWLPYTCSRHWRSLDHGLFRVALCRNAWVWPWNWWGLDGIKYGFSMGCDCGRVRYRFVVLEKGEWQGNLLNAQKCDFPSTSPLSAFPCFFSPSGRCKRSSIKSLKTEVMAQRLGFFLSD